MLLFEKIMIYVALITGVLFAFLTGAGIESLNRGDFGRGTLYLMITLLTVVGWTLPLVPKLRPQGARAGRALLTILLSLSVYAFAREYLAPGLPNLWPH